MRILITLDNWGLIGGSERYAGDVVRALAARGHAVSVLCGAVRQPDLALPRESQRLVQPGYSDPEASERELEALAQAARATEPEVIFMLTCFQARTFAALEPV